MNFAGKRVTLIRKYILMILYAKLEDKLHNAFNVQMFTYMWFPLFANSRFNIYLRNYCNAEFILHHKIYLWQKCDAEK